MQRVKDPTTRDWYLRQAIEHGWSRSVLELQIDSRAHERHGKAITNFKAALPPADSDMAGQVFKDPYLFDFLGTADPRREREVEQALVDHIQNKPIGIAEWETKIVEKLPEELRGSLPTVE